MTTPTRPLRPFLYLAAVAGIVMVAMIQLPDSFVSQLERNRALSTRQAGWAYRLMAIAAAAQAAYGGFSILRIERVRNARENEPKVAAMSRDQILLSVARTAAVISGLTLVYGLAAFAVTGERGGFWLFALILLAQSTWYFHQVGEIRDWLVWQPETSGPPRTGWTLAAADYSPPLARGAVPGEPNSGQRRT